MKKVLYFTMKSCGPCKIIGPQVEAICKKYDVPMMTFQLDESEGKQVGQHFKVFMTPEVVLLENLIDNTKPLDQNPNATALNVPGSDLPNGLELLLKPIGRPLPNDVKPKTEKNTLITGGKIVLALYCIKKIFFS